MRNILQILLVAAISSGLALAADLSGTYATVGGKSDETLVLKIKGQDVSGTLKNKMGQFALQDGSVDGQDIFFNIYIDRDGDHFKMSYRGHSFGDEIQFKIEAGERMLDLVVSKQS